MVRLVAAKEILSTLRDRRAILSNLLIPFLVLPVVMLGLPFLLGGLFEREAEEVSEVGLKGDLPPALARQLEAQNVAPRPVDDPAAAVEAGTYQAALEVPEDLTARLRAGEPVPLTVYSKAGNLRSEVVTSKIERAVDAYRGALVAERLRSVGLSPKVLKPVTLETVDASTPAEQASGTLGWLIPFFITIWTLTGGQMTAIDATAGEKERGTLEALLVTPVRRLEVVLGKFLATLTFGLTAAVMAILGYVLGSTVLTALFLSRLGPEAAELTAAFGGGLDISLLSVGALLISSLLLAALIAALLISITTFARSFKEAQSYVAPLSLLLVLPVIGLQFADFFAFGPLLYAAPVLGTLYAMNEIVQGNLALTGLLLSWGSSLFFTGLLLAFAYRSFKREGVLFRT